MIALACYFDDSVTHPDLQIHVVAGYLAPTWSWDRDFIPEWRRLIEKAPHPITELHTSDCRGGRDEFGPPWTGPQRNKLIRNCITVIQDTPGLIGIASGFIWPGAPDPSMPAKKLTKAKRYLQEKAYRVCVGYCLEDAVKICERSAEFNTIDEVQPVIDLKSKFARIVGDSFELILKGLPPQFAEKIAPPVHRDSTVVLPLQAADLLAHETLMEIKNRCDGIEPRRDMNRLLASGAYMGRVFLTPPAELYNLLKAAGRSVKPRREVLYESHDGKVWLRTEGQWKVDD